MGVEAFPVTIPVKIARACGWYVPARSTYSIIAPVSSETRLNH